MIVSSKPNRSSSRWLRMGVLACALVLLPLGLASAQDYEAVAQRLKESVKQGEITPQQADAMMAALKKGAVKKSQDTDKTTARPLRLKKEVGPAVKTDKIRKNDAGQKHEAAAKGPKEKTVAKSEGRTDLEAAWKKLQAKVQAGDLTKEQALAKMSALKEAAAQKDQTPKKDLQKKPAAKGQGHIDLDAAWKKLQAKVQAGELTKKQAQAQMAALKEETVQKNRDSDKAATSPTKVKKDLGAAVEAGKKDAPTKDIKKKPAAQPDYDAIGRDLKAAVQAGTLTKEEAKAKWEALRKEAGPDKKNK